MAETPRITYVRGRALAEIARLIFAVKDIEPNEEYITTKAEYESLKATGKLMFQQLPLIEIDGVCLIESGAQGNYLGYKYDMLGQTNEERANVQMLFFGSKSFWVTSAPHWPFLEEEKREGALKAAIEKAKSRYLPVFEKALKENGRGFLVGNSPTIADCGLFNILSYFKDGPEYGNLLDEAPLCKAFIDKFSEIPGVKKYLSSPRRFPPPDAAYAKEVKAALSI